MIEIWAPGLTDESDDNFQRTASLSHYRFKIINYTKKHNVDNEGLRPSDSVVRLL